MVGGILVFLMAGIQQIALDDIVPSTKIHVRSDQMLPCSFLVRIPLLLIFLSHMSPHYVVEIAIRFGSTGQRGRRGTIRGSVVLDIVEQSFYGRYVSFDALLECASEYMLNTYKKCTLTLIVWRLLAAVDWLFSGFGFETNELYQPSSYMVVMSSRVACLRFNIASEYELIWCLWALVG